MASDRPRNSPLSPATLHILLALAGGNLHGYGIIQEVARNTDGHYPLGPGTLYDNLKKLMDTGLVADAPKSTSSRRKSAAAKEDDRRFYTLTKEGRAALTSEVDRLQSVITQARLRLQEARSGRA
jgi:DNA-binding PadR family transcriptional regulator